VHAPSNAGVVLGLRVDRVDYTEAVDRVLGAASERRVYRVAAANVHVVMEARDDPSLAALLAHFELVVPDGQPLRWVLNASGGPHLEERVYGPELMRRVCAGAEARAIPVYCHGATEAVLADLRSALQRDFPSLRIAGAHAPGFGEALWSEAESDVQRIRESGARLVFVGLGCPRQERWVGLYAERVGMPCLAVGAAFELLAGRRSMAPAWLQERGLEWAYRLATEPERTWRRYLLHNPRFAVAATRGLLADRLRRRAPPGRDR
jgi:N-acetylglucosaminyldiphosphoundecaprenol N-acetyl-beta-D-mannosaminyltransferase